MTNGWVKIHRKILNWEWFSDINTFRLFIYLLITANFEDKKWRGIEVKRGSIITSIPKLATGAGLSIQQTRTCISHLQSTCEITVQTTNEYSIISITNYDLYQMNDMPINRQSTCDQHAGNMLSTCDSTTTKEVKNDGEGKVSEEVKNNNTAPKVAKFSKPEGVSDQLWEDFKKLRSAKKAPITQTALNKIIEEAEKVGFSLSDAIETMISRNWQGFKAEWIPKDMAKNTKDKYDLQIERLQNGEF